MEIDTKGKEMTENQGASMPNAVNPKELKDAKTLFVEDLKPGMRFRSYFIAKSIEVKQDKNGKDYLAAILGDMTGDISAKFWGITDEDKERFSVIQAGSSVKVEAQVQEYNHQNQLVLDKLRLTEIEDNIDMSLLIKAAPEDAKEMYDFIVGKANAMEDEELKKIALTLMERNYDKLQYYPAAAKNHHAERSGLLWHMKRMLMSGEALCGVYTFLNKDLVLTGVIVHDMEKLNEIDAERTGLATGYSKKGQLLGHIVQGVSEMGKLCDELGVSEEKALLLEHMILSHHYQPEFGSPKRPMFPEAEILHYLDIMDARMYDMEEAVQGVEEGGFSERVWTLDNRRIYKPMI